MLYAFHHQRSRGVRTIAVDAQETPLASSPFKQPAGQRLQCTRSADHPMAGAEEPTGVQEASPRLVFRTDHMLADLTHMSGTPVA